MLYQPGSLAAFRYVWRVSERMRRLFSSSLLLFSLLSLLPAPAQQLMDDVMDASPQHRRIPTYFVRTSSKRTASRSLT